MQCHGAASAPALLPSTGAPVQVLLSALRMGLSLGPPALAIQAPMGRTDWEVSTGGALTRPDPQEHPSPCRRSAAESCGFGGGIGAVASSWNSAGVRAWHLCPLSAPKHTLGMAGPAPLGGPAHSSLSYPSTAHPQLSIHTFHLACPPPYLGPPRTAPLSCNVSQALWGIELPGHGQRRACGNWG